MRTYLPCKMRAPAFRATRRLKLDALAAVLGLAARRTADIVADAPWLIYLLVSWLEAVRTHGKSATNALEQAQSGEGVLTLPVGVVARPAGVLRRIFDLVEEMKKNNACTEPMCKDLGTLGSAEAEPDFALLRPAIAATATAAGIQLGWGWQGLVKFLDQCEIQADRTDGIGWAVRTYDTTPGYKDTTPFPTALTKWKYRVDDQQVGLWGAQRSA